jgi:hypothetical protein
LRNKCKEFEIGREKEVHTNLKKSCAERKEEGGKEKKDRGRERDR